MDLTFNGIVLCAIFLRYSCQTYKRTRATDAIPFSPFVTVRVIIGPEATKAVTVRLVPVKTGVFLNFFLNPCVYIWEHREERRAVIDKLRAFLSFLPLAVTNDNRNCSPF